eukprot:3701718-Amphidinium_carterae.1
MAKSVSLHIYHHERLPHRVSSLGVLENAALLVSHLATMSHEEDERDAWAVGLNGRCKTQADAPINAVASPLLNRSLGISRERLIEDVFQHMSVKASVACCGFTTRCRLSSLNKGLEARLTKPKQKRCHPLATSMFHALCCCFALSYHQGAHLSVTPSGPPSARCGAGGVAESTSRFLLSTSVAFLSAPRNAFEHSVVP